MSEIIVKPLEWTQSGDDFIAASVVGEYEILQTPQAWTAFRNGQGLSRHNDNPEAAKAAAQSDYEARIRSALVSSPGKVAAPINWENANDPAVKLFVSYDVEGYVEEHEFCADEGYYTPNESEKGLLIDAIYGVVSDIHEKLRALSVPLPEIEGGDKGDGWQTMETAPKDRTVVLLWNKDWLHPVMGYWSKTINAWLEYGSRDAKANIATHWRPLPAAPSASIEGETKP